jgi:hypothetical protein
MKLLCRLRGHRPGGRQIMNRVMCFTRCTRCGADLVRHEGFWGPVPKGFRIVWKAAEDGHRGQIPPPPPQEEEGA